MPRTFKLTLEYDGTRFNGWQLQANADRTVQGELEKAVSRIFKKSRIPVIGSGRTDRGVHARGQVAHFRVSTPMPPDEIMRALNYNIPPDIAVIQCVEASADFHAQHSAKSKIYTYTILNRPYPTALDRNRCCYFPRKIDFKLLKSEAQAFLGEHDFSAFANVDASRKGDAIRHISRLDIRKVGPYIRVSIQSDGFLYKMVRNIVGTLLEVAAGRFPPGSVSTMLLSRDRRCAGVAAVPQGLCLEEVIY